MSWSRKYKVRGNPTITGNKPGAEIEAVLEEIQDKAITEAEGSVPAEQVGVPHNLEIIVSRRANKIEIGGRVFIEIPSPSAILPEGAEQYMVLQWNGSEWVADWVRAT